jgi:phosphoglucomutase
MDIVSVPDTSFAGQRPGTSGLRKKVAVFQQPGYVEAFVQAPARHALSASAVLASLAAASVALADVSGITGRERPSVVA